MSKQKFFDSDLACQISFHSEIVQAALVHILFFLNTIWSK